MLHDNHVLNNIRRQIDCTFWFLKKSQKVLQSRGMNIKPSIPRSESCTLRPRSLNWSLLNVFSQCRSVDSRALNNNDSMLLLLLRRYLKTRVRFFLLKSWPLIPICLPNLQLNLSVMLRTHGWRSRHSSPNAKPILSSKTTKKKPPAISSSLTRSQFPSTLNLEGNRSRIRKPRTPETAGDWFKGSTLTWSV